MTIRVTSGVWAWWSLSVPLDVSLTYSLKTSKNGQAFMNSCKQLWEVHHLLLHQINFPQNSVHLSLLGKIHSMTKLIHRHLKELCFLNYFLVLLSIQKDPRDRSSALDLLVSKHQLVTISILFSLLVEANIWLFLHAQTHAFIKKFEDKDIDLSILVGSLEPPVNFPR